MSLHRRNHPPALMVSSLAPVARCGRFRARRRRRNRHILHHEPGRPRRQRYLDSASKPRRFSNYTRSIGGTIAAAEMFNEPTFASMGGAPKGYNAADYGRDFRAFHDFLKKAAPAMRSSAPAASAKHGRWGRHARHEALHSENMLRAQGPGPSMPSPTTSTAAYRSAARAWARVPLAPPPKPRSPMHWLARTDRDEAFYAALRDRFAPGKPLWLTETGETACGGDPWASDFIDSFRYLNQLGSLAQSRRQSRHAQHPQCQRLCPPRRIHARAAPQLLGCSPLAQAHGHHRPRSAISSRPASASMRTASATSRAASLILAINADKTIAHDVCCPPNRRAKYSLRRI